MSAMSSLSRGLGFVTRAVSGPNKPALVVSLLVSLFAALFVASYSLAMGNPQPHDVPIGLVSETVTATTFDQSLESVTTTSFDVTMFATEEAAKEAIEQQQIYGALVTATAGQDAQLYVSSASGASIARLIESDSATIAQKLGVTVTVTDLNPLSPSDPSGLVLFYLALACTIIGFVGAIQTRVNAGLTLAGEVTWDVVRAVLVGLVVTLTAGPILGFERFPFVPVWAVLATTVMVGGSVYSFFRVVVGGRWALVPTWILFILVSNPSSGGAVAPQLLPPFYEFMGRWMPTGATVRALRDLTYFPDAPHAEPYIVLGGWLLVSTAAFIVARRITYGAGRLE